ncbi:MAG: hypothetical protein N2593_01895 [Patescibacteria group bacterium]|nr:hypothetical protein [Patescibacteria group bacterium]
MKKETIVSHGSLKEFMNDGDDKDKYYLPARELALLGDHHFVPNHPDVLRYAEQLNFILQNGILQPRNIHPIPDTNYLLDLAILQNLSLVKKILRRNKHYTVYPYAVTQETLSWIEELRKRGFFIDPAFPEKKYFDNLRHPSHRGGWGRWIENPETPSFAENHNIPYPVSWIGCGLKQIIEAYQRVVESTENEKAFFKPIFSAGGFTLAQISSVEELMAHYEKLIRLGALSLFNQEIPVEIQAYIEDIKGLFSFQYNENGKLITPNGFSEQIIENNQWQGNLFNVTNIPPEIRQQLSDIWRNFAVGYRTWERQNFGWGGLDLALTPNGLIVLEHNGLRTTGAHSPIHLAEQLGVINNSFATLKSPGEVKCDLKTLWEVLSVNGIAFNPNTRQGIFPIVWFPGSGMLWATGENPLRLLNKAYNILAQENYIL